MLRGHCHTILQSGWTILPPTAVSESSICSTSSPALRGQSSPFHACRWGCGPCMFQLHCTRTLCPPDFFFFLIYLLIWLLQVLVETHGIFDLHCGMHDLYLWHVGSSFLTRDQTQAPGIGSPESQPLDHQGSPCPLDSMPSSPLGTTGVQTTPTSLKVGGPLSLASRPPSPSVFCLPLFLLHSLRGSSISA